ncbi:MAG: chemotaxis-specific protein-glutamate methyltransferase CheB [Oscillatoriophycideae cyanobacterium NC_groundwater_1537_Pr4_S-0.65um_50_18]|nr:chemotaxis-specific protein-glutamate methyltransferase CheB [Oscillatoriophycideae cyanobacterium NC_groundwater_1537_Pr4_S-0.65um_50_18]
MPVRVLLVEDSEIALVILKRILETSPQIKVVGTACNGLEALQLIPQTRPDVICTDLHMPQMNGLELTTEVMAIDPRPILVISASVQEDDRHTVFQLLEAGAVDIFPKPSIGLTAVDRSFDQALISKIKVLSGVKVFTRKRKVSTQRQPLESKNWRTGSFHPYPKPQIVVVGASTGGPQALQELFTSLPADFPLPILCVQHISLGFLQGLIDWLSNDCRLPIQIARPGDRPCPGTIYFPQEGQHLELDTRGRFVCSDKPLVDGHRPSATATFQSVVNFYGQKTIGILLTGMGRDGADGMRSIAQAGGFTIAQNEATSVVFGMPKEAIALGAAKQILPIHLIAPALLNWLNN